ncbi:MAG: DUF3307 domain-containing protein [Halolamina sp.]
MSEWLTALGPEGTAFALLVLGHVLGDFTFQTDAQATNKHRVGPLLSHSGTVFAVHVLVFVPLLTPQTAVVIGFVGVSHFVIDAISARLRRERGESVRLFLADQTVHLLVLLVAWSVITHSTWTNAPVVTALGGVDRLPWVEITTGAVYLSAFAFAHEGGNTIVDGVLPADQPEPDGEDLEAGSLIGTLERWIVLLLGVAGRWEAVAIVVAAKSIARFEELKKQAFAEYFLVGTLTSVLVAFVLAILVSFLV